MAGFSGIPVLAGVSHIAIPNWVNVACFIIGAVGGIVVGVSAKGQDEHSTLNQVETSTEVVRAEQAVVATKQAEATKP